MAKIKIGERSFEAVRTNDAEAKLLEATGCSAAEIAAQLVAGGTAFHVARALHPMLSDNAPGIGDLAEAILDDDLPALRMEVAEMLSAKTVKAANPAAAA